MDFVRKVSKDGTDEFYVLRCEWKEDHFSIFVIDRDRAWTGKLCSSDPALESLCEMLGKSVQDYFAELKRSLSTDTEGQVCFLLEHQSFLVKKKDVKTGIKMKFCSVPVQEYSAIEAYSNILGTAIEKLNQYANEKKSLQDEVSALKSDRGDLIRNLELLKEMKNTMENTLYAKFLEVLNAKKAHLVAEALVAEKELSIPAQPQNSHEVGRNDIASKRKRIIESCFREQQCDEVNTSTAIDESHYDSETEEDTEEELASDMKENTDDEKGMQEVLAEPVVSSTLHLQPSTSAKSVQRILPKRGNKGQKSLASKDPSPSTKSTLIITETSSHQEKFKSQNYARKFNHSDEGKEMGGASQDPAKLSERILPKIKKGRADISTSSSVDYAISDTLPVPAVNCQLSDSEEDSATSAADSTIISSERILPKRFKRESKQTNKDSLPCVIPNTSVNDAEFNTQSLLSEFD